jgi:hypothetical protein
LPANLINRKLQQIKAAFNGLTAMKQKISISVLKYGNCTYSSHLYVTCSAREIVTIPKSIDLDSFDAIN